MDLKMDLKHQLMSKLSRTGSITSEKSIERRKPNWTECENVFLLDQFSLHREILTCKATDASTNLRKQEVWRIICQNLNIQNSLVRRTPAEVRRKWKNLVTAAKKELWEIRHAAHVTGASRKISELSSRVIQLHSSASSSSNSSALSALFLNHQNSSQASEDFANNNEIDKMSLSDYYQSSSHHHPSAGHFINSIHHHFAPIVELSENVSSPTGSCASSSDSRNDFDSGIYEEATDLRVNVEKDEEEETSRKFSESTREEEPKMTNGNVMLIKTGVGFDKNCTISNSNGGKISELGRVKLELQVEVLRLRKRKLEIELRKLRRTGTSSIWRRRINIARRGK